MDRNGKNASGRSELPPEERWLREALAPGAGASDRIVAAALAGCGSGRRTTPAWGSLAAAAALVLGLGVLLVWRPPSLPAPRPEPPAEGTLLLTNASGPVRLVRVPPAPLPPLVRPAAGEGCTTVYWSRGSVVAVYETCGDGTIRIEGGAS